MIPTHAHKALSMRFERGVYDCRHATFDTLRELGFDPPLSVVEIDDAASEVAVDRVVDEASGFWKVIGHDYAAATQPGDVIVTLDDGMHHLMPMISPTHLITRMGNEMRATHKRIASRLTVTSVVRPTRRMI